MTPEDVPYELVKVAADNLQANGLWGAWRRRQTEDQVRAILAAVLPLYDRGPRTHETQPPEVISYGLTAKQHAALEAAGRAALDNPQPPKPRVVLVAGFRWEVDRWCDQNQRSHRDPRIIHIGDGRRDAHKLQGLTDFDLFVLSEIPHHNEAMAQISHRLATAPREDPSQ